MAETDLLSQGVTLLIYGMGVVFVFLTLLVLATQAMSSIVSRYTPEISKPDSPNEPGIDPRHVAAITAAIHQHRKISNKNLQL